MSNQKNLTGIVWCRFEANAGWRVEEVIPATREVLATNLPDVCAGFASLRLRVRDSLAFADLKAGQFCNPRKLIGV